MKAFSDSKLDIIKTITFVCQMIETLWKNEKVLVTKVYIYIQPQEYF